MWQRIGSRSGPGRDRPMPATVPSDWADDRGQFISHPDFRVVWRRGRWEKRHDKVSKTDKISFFFYGPGYSDYECTQMAVKQEEFLGD